MRTSGGWASLALVVTACSSNGAGAGGAPFPATPAAALDGTSHVVHFEIRTSPQPPARGVSRAELRVTKLAGGAPVDGLTVAAVPWMPAMGHSASVQPTVSAEGSGKYLVDDVDFFMPGRWELRVSARGAVEDDATFTFDVE
jgi:hypothetical protein